MSLLGCHPCPGAKAALGSGPALDQGAGFGWDCALKNWSPNPTGHSPSVHWLIAGFVEKPAGDKSPFSSAEIPLSQGEQTPAKLLV